MGGEVWADSELNKGSRFFFSMPTVSSDVDGSKMGELSAHIEGTNAQESATG